MKSTAIVSVCIVAGALVAVGAYQLGLRQHAGARPDQSVTAPNPAKASDPLVDPKTGRKVLYWHDPMAPGKKFDKPGKSPFMDMPLVPVYADESAGPGVSVSAGVTQSLGIRTALVRKADLAASLDVVGVVAPNERATEVVQSRVTGYIEKLHVRAVLDPVKKGQALATIHAPEWAAALEEYLGVRRAQPGPALVDAARARLRLLSIPDSVVASSEQSGKAQSRFTLTAPASGVVAELGVRDGAMVSPGMTLFRIVDLGSVWVMASVPEALAGRIRSGSQAEVRVAGIADAFTGKFSAVLPDVDPATRAVKARVELRNPGLVLKPGMFVRVALKQEASEQALVVPQESVITTGKRSVVILALDGGKYSPVEVTLGRENGADIEVRSGLSEGQKVVASGQFMLDSEASLKSGLSRLDTGPAKAPSSPSHSAEGKVESIDKDGVTIAHGPVPSLKWGAMTMAFKNPPGGPPKDLKVGARIHFEFVQQGDEYVLQHVMPLGAGTKP